MSAMRLALLFLLLAPGSVASGDGVVLRDGSRQPVEAATLAHASDATWPGWVALVRTPGAPPVDAPTSMLALDDGQRVAGGFQVVQDVLWWRSRTIGSVQIDLEHVAWIGPTALGLQKAPARDRVSLVNGDRVEGFVSALQADRGIEVETGTGGANATRTWCDLVKVSSIQLAPRPRAATGWRLWLADGSVIDADAWSREGSRVSLQGLHLPGVAPRVMIAWDELLGVCRNSDAPVPLASLPWQSDEATESVRLAPAQVRVDGPCGPLDLRPIDLHGPGSFRVRVPDGRWVLDLGISEPSALAGRVACTVQVLAGDRELARMRVDRDTKPVGVRAPVEGGEVRVVISDPAHGAFGAAVRLDNAMLVPVRAGEAVATPSPTSAPAAPSDSRDPG